MELFRWALSYNALSLASNHSKRPEEKRKGQKCHFFTNFFFSVVKNKNCSHVIPQKTHSSKNEI